ncbi:MAG: hypothetical protein SGPRY_013041 [Prymnesium sp.]
MASPPPSFWEGVRLLLHRDEAANLLACEAIGRTAAHPRSCPDLFLSPRQLAPFVRLVCEASPALASEACRAIARLAQRSRLLQDNLAATGLLPALVRLLHTSLSQATLLSCLHRVDKQEAGLLCAACDAICCLSGSNATNQRRLLDAAVVPPLVQLLREGMSRDLRLSALATLMCVAGSSEQGRVAVREASCFKPIVIILHAGLALGGSDDAHEEQAVRMVEMSMSAVSLFVTNHPENQAAAREADCIAAVVGVLRTLHDAESEGPLVLRIQHRACDALLGLAEPSTAQR